MAAAMTHRSIFDDLAVTVSQGSQQRKRRKKGGGIIIDQPQQQRKKRSLSAKRPFMRAQEAIMSMSPM